MTTGHQPCLTAEVLNLDVKYHMKIYPSVSSWCTLSIRKNFKHSLSIFHPLGYIVRPMGVTIILVNQVGVSHGLGYFNSILGCLLEVSGVTSLYERYNTITFLEGLVYPPVECWLIIKITCSGIFSRINRITILEVRQFLPCGGTIFPEYANFPTSS